MPIFDGVELPEGKTPWAVTSGHCGDTNDDFRVYLTCDDYTAQLRNPDSGWVCPHGVQAHWDDDWHEGFLECAEGAWHAKLVKGSKRGGTDA